MDIKKLIRTVPDWPKKGIMFRDITSLLKDKDGFQAMNDALYERYKDSDIDYVVGIDARGFIMGSVLADRLGVGFIPVRKKNKLPPEVVGQAYELEYGTDTIEVNGNSLEKGSKVILVDDLIATGGTALAACRLIEKIGGKVEEAAFVIDLPDVGGRKKLEDAGYKVFYMVGFEGD